MKKNLISAGGLVAVLAGLIVLMTACSDASSWYPQVVVYKNPTCGCCEKWIDQMKAAGFSVKVSDTPNVDPLKRQHNVPEEARSCHTALVGGYVVEGHVPIEDVIRMLKDRPDIDGIATPGMPMGSPGMEGPRKDAYNVVAFSGGVPTYIFASH